MEIKNLFQLNPEVVFLNHGSFGACPKPVMEEYLTWQRKMEFQPVEFLGRNHASLLKTSREKLSEFLQASPDDLVYVSNATTALNIIAWSIDLKPGDEVLGTNLEYGAMDRMWELICLHKGAKYIKVQIDLPIKSEELFVEAFMRQVNGRTKVIFASMITSSTALYLPLYKLCRIANSQGIISVIDGAHVPGQFPVQLDISPFDFFAGNCHKWMFAPKGTAFLYAKKNVQHLIKPLIISWGKEIDTLNNSDFINDMEYLGTRDISGFLTVPLCVSFLDEYLNQNARAQIYDLLIYAKDGMELILKTPKIVDSLERCIQMYAHQLPENVDGKMLKQKLYDDFKIEIPVSNQNGKQFIRISLQIYNIRSEVDFFLNKLEYLVSKCLVNSK
jgi:isopenicillin-N epimerase